MFQNGYQLTPVCKAFKLERFIILYLKKGGNQIKYIQLITSNGLNLLKNNVGYIEALFIAMVLNLKKMFHMDSRIVNSGTFRNKLRHYQQFSK